MPLSDVLPDVHLSTLLYRYLPLVKYDADGHAIPLATGDTVDDRVYDDPVAPLVFLRKKLLKPFPPGMTLQDGLGRMMGEMEDFQLVNPDGCPPSDPKDSLRLFLLRVDEAMQYPIMRLCSSMDRNGISTFPGFRKAVQSRAAWLDEFTSAGSPSYVGGEWHGRKARRRRGRGVDAGDEDLTVASTHGETFRLMLLRKQLLKPFPPQQMFLPVVLTMQEQLEDFQRASPDGCPASGPKDTLRLFLLRFDEAMKHPIEALRERLVQKRISTFQSSTTR